MYPNFSHLKNLEQPRLWGVSFDHFIFAIEGEDHTHVVRLSDGVVAKVKNFAQEKGGKLRFFLIFIVKYVTSN